MTDEFEFYDAPYLLGTLDPGDLVAFERHLAGCPDCAARVDVLRGTVEALHAARDAGLGGPPPPLLPHLLERAAIERRRRRMVVAGSGLLAAAAVVALLLVLLVGGSTPARAPAAQPLQPVNKTSKIHVTAAVVSRGWGTQIDLKCRYDNGFTPKVPYDLIVIGTDNAKHPAGSWRLVPGQETTFTGGTDVTREQIRSIQVTLPDGRPVLQLNL